MTETTTRIFWCPMHRLEHLTPHCGACKACHHTFKPLNEKLDYCTKCLTQRAKKKEVIYITKL